MEVMSFYILLSFAVFVIGCVLISIIIYRNARLPATLLSLSLFALTYSIFLIFCFESRYILLVPFLYRTGGLAGYLITPALYLYIIFVLHERRRFKWLDTIHLLPALLYLVDFMPFFLKSNESKLEMLEAMFNDPKAVLYFQEGWLVPSGMHNIVRNAVSLVYFFFLGRALFHPEHYKAYQAGYKVLNWFRAITFLYFLLSLAGIATILILPSPSAWPFTVLAILLIFLMISLILFSEPYILYGYDDHKVKRPHDEKAKSPGLPPQLGEQVGLKLRSYIRDKQYLHKNIKLDAVAKDLDVKPYILSAYINSEYQMHFTDLINHYRIQYIKEGLLNEEWSDLTLEAIAEKAGFSNRTTFLTAFKKDTGMTPTNFMRSHRPGNIKKTPDKI
jgi:AraC-like DNA-binding protein